MIFVSIFYAIIFVIAWILVVKYRRTVKSWTGNFMWAERYLWTGSTYLVIILAWLFLVFLGLSFPFWWLDFFFWHQGGEIIK